MVAPRDARHAFAVLAGSTSTGGGMVAAATMSLPERAREGRNYDYRYAWIRDQCYAGQAVAAVGPHPLLDDAVRFVRRSAARPTAPISARLHDERRARCPTSARSTFPGYPGGADIVGNQVNQQFQLDAFGEALLLFAAAARHDRLDADGWRAAEIAAARSRTRWQEPDAGIWELEPDEWTHSRLICAAGLRAISRSRARAASSRLAGSRSPTRSSRTPRPAALHPSGRWQRSPGDERIDAALLLPAIRGRDPAPTTHARSPRCEPSPTTSTEDGYAYRFRPDARPLGEAEGAFLLCGFLMSLAARQQGDRVERGRWFERNRAACGPPGPPVRGIRHRATPAAREPATGVRPCIAARVRRPAARLAGPVAPMAPPRHIQIRPAPERASYGGEAGWHRRLLMAALAAAGCALSFYLALFQLHVLGDVWEPLFGNGGRAVLRSSFSRSLPVPDALLGSLSYLAEVILDLAGPVDRRRTSPHLVLAFGAVVAAMAVVSLFLVGLQVVVYHAFCTLCLASAAVSWVIAVLAAEEIRAAWQARGRRM